MKTKRLLRRTRVPRSRTRRILTSLPRLLSQCNNHHRVSRQLYRRPYQPRKAVIPVPPTDIEMELVEEELSKDMAKSEQIQNDGNLVQQRDVCVEQCLDKIRPICEMIIEKIDEAERTSEDERDEEALVREVRQLIEDGGSILQKAKGIIKSLDTDGRIAANANEVTGNFVDLIHAFFPKPVSPLRFTEDCVLPWTGHIPAAMVWSKKNGIDDEGHMFKLRNGPESVG
ncbi:hypothetical protein B0H66DRAFT_14504 [Apodospora peruviana]|uniref:DUF6987 domain-containing protein n=1 Tax=Apodospora peruviana TaxID=516989 RepID=A0AAE0IQL3_9PEZI|nr:hypothetical protein B0H66DRAFT_14504 [Apodospora peruviana]